MPARLLTDRFLSSLLVSAKPGGNDLARTSHGTMRAILEDEWRVFSSIVTAPPLPRLMLHPSSRKAPRQACVLYTMSYLHVTSIFASSAWIPPAILTSSLTLPLCIFTYKAIFRTVMMQGTLPCSTCLHSHWSSGCREDDLSNVLEILL